jgi:hypothetical protein
MIVVAPTFPKRNGASQRASPGLAIMAIIKPEQFQENLMRQLNRLRIVD